MASNITTFYLVQMGMDLISSHPTNEEATKQAKHWSDNHPGMYVYVSKVQGAYHKPAPVKLAPTWYIAKPQPLEEDDEDVCG